MLLWLAAECRNTVAQTASKFPLLLIMRRDISDPLSHLQMAYPLYEHTQFLDANNKSYLLCWMTLMHSMLKKLYLCLPSWQQFQRFPEPKTRDNLMKRSLVFFAIAIMPHDFTISGHETLGILPFPCWFSIMYHYQHSDRHYKTGGELTSKFYTSSSSGV